MGARERLTAAREATADGRYDDALADLLWFHHHALEEDAALRGVRLSYALADWLALAEVYPPAHEAMLAVRAQKADALLRGEGGPSLFHDVEAIDATRDRPGDTHALFLAVQAAHPDLAAKCVQFALPHIVAVGDYRLGDRLWSDPVPLLRRRARGLSVEANMSKYWRHTKAPVRWATVEHYAEVTRLAVAIKTGIGRPDEARRLAALAVALIDDPSLRAEARAAIARGTRRGWHAARRDHLDRQARRREARHRRRA